MGDEIDVGSYATIYRGRYFKDKPIKATKAQTMNTKFFAFKTANHRNYGTVEI